MRLRKYSQWKFGIVLGIGGAIAAVLCIQCVRTYLYADSVLVPEQAQHEADRQAGALTAAARSAGITSPLALAPLIEHVIESASDRVLSMRVLDKNGTILVQRGIEQSSVPLPSHWWERVERHERLGTQISTPEGKALLVALPLRMARPLHSDAFDLPGQRPDDRRNGYVLVLIISLKTVANSFSTLRHNLILGLIGSLALLACLAIIGRRAPH